LVNIYQIKQTGIYKRKICLKFKNSQGRNEWPVFSFRFVHLPIICEYQERRKQRKKRKEGKGEKRGKERQDELPYSETQPGQSIQIQKYKKI
jgi:hypothetical protein